MSKRAQPAPELSGSELALGPTHYRVKVRKSYDTGADVYLLYLTSTQPSRYVKRYKDLRSLHKGLKKIVPGYQIETIPIPHPSKPIEDKIEKKEYWWQDHDKED